MNGRKNFGKGDGATCREGRRWGKLDAVFQISRRDAVDGDLAADEFGGKGAGE